MLLVSFIIRIYLHDYTLTISNIFIVYYGEKFPFFAQLFKLVIQTKCIEVLTQVTFDLHWSTAYRV